MAAEVFPAIGIVWRPPGRVLPCRCQIPPEAKSLPDLAEEFRLTSGRVERHPDLLGQLGEGDSCLLRVPITNAYTERQNGLARVIDCMGHGYSFEAIRAKLLLARRNKALSLQLPLNPAQEEGRASHGRYMCLMTNGDNGLRNRTGAGA